MEDAPQGPGLGPLGIRDTLRISFFQKGKSISQGIPNSREAMEDAPEGQGSATGNIRYREKGFSGKENAFPKVSCIPGRPGRTPPEGQGSGPWEYGIP